MRQVWHSGMNRFHVYVGIEVYFRETETMNEHCKNEVVLTAW